MGRIARARSRLWSWPWKLTEVAGSVTNLAFLAALARDPDFASGDVDTGLIDRKQAALTPIPAASEQVVAEAVLAASGIDGAASSADPWDSLAGYAHFHPVARLVRLRRGQEEIAARAAIGAGGTVGVTFEGAAPFHKSEGKATARRGKPHEPGDARQVRHVRRCVVLPPCGTFDGTDAGCPLAGACDGIPTARWVTISPLPIRWTVPTNRRRPDRCALRCPAWSRSCARRSATR